jgi:poly(hydroxyalkanoate) granule-associated protein
MAKKPSPASQNDSQPSAPMGDAVRDSAQQIWQAGLGAFTRAQAEGSKAFEALVQEGVSMQRKTQAAAEQRLAEATSKMNSMASELSSKATGQWDKLETIFEDRVARALNKLGVPSAKDVNVLIAKIDALSLAVENLSKASAQAATKPASKTAAKSAAKTVAKPAAKVAAKKSAQTPGRASTKG